MQMKNLEYLLLFCRIVVGMVFMLSVLGKIRALEVFKQTIVAFKILPYQFVNISTLIFIFAEAAVFFILLIGKSWIAVGFILAILLLSIFCLALISVLARRISTPCNCFGKNSKNDVSIHDIWRNLMIISVSLCGSVLAMTINVNGSRQIAFSEILLTAPAAIITVIFLVNFSDIVHLFSNSSKKT